MLWSKCVHYVPFIMTLICEKDLSVLIFEVFPFLLDAKTFFLLRFVVKYRLQKKPLKIKMGAPSCGGKPFFSIFSALVLTRQRALVVDLLAQFEITGVTLHVFIEFNSKNTARRSLAT